MKMLVTMSASCNDRLSSLSLTQIQMNKVDNIKDVTIKEVAETEDENTGRRQYNYTLTFKYKKCQCDHRYKCQSGGAVNG